MRSPILEFTAPGSARAVARGIEAYAAERRVVSALVVPWESDATVLSMAVTSTRGDGWAIEHANLGTIALADLGGDRTRIAVIGHEPDQPEPDHPATDTRDRRAGVLSAFARQIEQTFAIAPTAEPRR
jgi:hypothetical protein